MELEQIFYLVAVLFALAAIVYFAWEYLDVLPRITKVVLLIMLAAVFFLTADVLRAKEGVSA
jgi:hypothetical protein